MSVGDSSVRLLSLCLHDLESAFRVQALVMIIYCRGLNSQTRFECGFYYNYSQEPAKK